MSPHTGIILLWKEYGLEYNALASHSPDARELRLRADQSFGSLAFVRRFSPGRLFLKKVCSQREYLILY